MLNEKNAPHCATAETFKLIEVYNAELSRINTARAENERNRQSILSDANGGVGTAAALRKRIRAVQDGELDCNLCELRLLATLPGIDDAVQRDWQAEACRLKTALADRVAVIEKGAVSLGLEGARLANFTLTDPDRRRLEDGWKDAIATANQSIIHAGDVSRLNELRASITSALK